MEINALDGYPSEALYRFIEPMSAAERRIGYPSRLRHAGVLKKESEKMDPTIGLYLVIGFVVVLCLGIWAFGKFSVRPD